VDTLDVSHERLDGQTAIILKCPTCGNTVRGTVADSDWSHVNQLLNPRKGA
jgi:hypothetical protein